ncbi:MAG: magnesium and cobalt transport protein CorA, partial [Flavobacterium sp.]|nr:magnesium and cobalt transport protein CorA [Flavobacterium sp.]
MRKIKYKNGRKLQVNNLEYTGIHKKTDSEMQLFVYDDSDLSEYENFNASDLEKNVNTQKINWLNIHGLNDIDLLKEVANYFEIDNFLLADVLNT